MNQEEIYARINDAQSKNIELPDQVKRLSDREIDKNRGFPNTLLANQSLPDVYYVDTSKIENFRNPTIDMITPISSNLNFLISDPVTSTLPTISANANTALNEINSSVYPGVYGFIPHTNRLSGVIALPDPNSPQNGDVPYLMATSGITKALSYIKYVDNGEIDPDPASLYNSVDQNAVTQLEIWENTIENNRITVESSLSYDDLLEIWSSNLTSIQITTISDSINNFTTYIEQIRELDETNYSGGLGQTTQSASNMYNVVNSLYSNSMNSIYSTV